MRPTVAIRLLWVALQGCIALLGNAAMAGDGYDQGRSSYRLGSNDGSLVLRNVSATMPPGLAQDSTPQNIPPQLRSPDEFQPPSNIQPMTPAAPPPLPGNHGPSGCCVEPPITGFLSGIPWPSIFDHSQRYTGQGQPLEGASWLNRPLSVGWFLGGIRNEEILTGRVDQDTSLLGGFRLGWDFDHYWGVETRLAFTDPTLRDEAAGVDLATDHIVLWDGNLLFYPWGDSRVRPFLEAGVGLASFRFFDEFGVYHSDGVVEVPLGGGLKYRCLDWLTLRLDLTDNIALGQSSGLRTMNNVSLTGGMEFRFGGPRPTYWPWNSRQYIW